jgi:phenylalanyl-tRNA synthetase beta chain
LFEIGKTFGGWGPDADLPIEIEEVAWILVGSMTAHWSAPDRSADVFDAKGILHVLLDEIGVVGWEAVPDAGMPFHPGRSARISVGDDMVGVIGEVRPSVAKAFDLDSAVLGELRLDSLFAAARVELEVSELATQPPVLRDISMWLPEGVAVAEVLETIRSSGGEHLETIEVLDEYRPEGEARRSVAFGLTFGAADRTLRAEDADAAREAAAAACRERHGAEVR